MEIGGYYQRKRNLPNSHVCRIETADREMVDRSVYEREVEARVQTCLVNTGLKEQVLYLVTTKGVPLRIEGSVGTNGTAAAVDSELTLLYLKMRGTRTPVAGPLRNPFYGKPGSPFRHPDFPMYLVTRLTAYDTAGAKALVDRALAAETSLSSFGKVYLDMRSSSDEDGDNWLLDAAVLLPKGRAEIDQGPEVMSGRKAAIGYASWGSNDKRNKERRPNFQWLPGGLATEYVSTDGRTFARPPKDWKIGTWADQSTYYVRSPQSLTADLIDDGATGASGHVDEPYLTFTPRPDRLFPAYLAGRNLAESFYLSIPALSWMNVVVGDPLCHLKVK
jgi:uncharacterized protein (TIGR03790 family)